MYGLNMSESDAAALQQAQTDMNSKDPNVSAAGKKKEAEIFRNYGVITQTGNAGENVAPGTPLPKSWENKGSGGSSSGGGGSSAPKGVSSATTTKNTMSMLAVQQNQAAQEQIKKQADYAVEQGVKELERAEADAQKQFQTQQNQVDIDEAKALDNQALYAEARGDRGGIGQAQYGQIQNTAMNNRRAINTARTELATTTARQIADLRAQGEFKKADALLQQTQVFLGQLMDIQKWGAEFTMQEAQFNAQLEQWKAEFDLKASEITGVYNGQMTMQAQDLLAQIGMDTARNGGDPTVEQLAAMQRLYGIDQTWVDAQKLAYQTAQENEALASQLKMAESALEIPNLVLTPAQKSVLLSAGWTEAMIAAKQKETNQKHHKATYIAPRSGDDKPGDTGGSWFEELYDNELTYEDEVVEYLKRVKKVDDDEARTMYADYKEWLNRESFGYKYGSGYKSAGQYVSSLLNQNKSNPQAAANAAAQYIDGLESGALTEYGFEQLCSYIEKQTGVSRSQWEF